MEKGFDRKQGIGGSDARMILAGRWHELWLEKTGRTEPVNLDDVFRVQLGKATEQFHRDWVVRREGLKLLPAPGTLRNERYPWAYAHIDALVQDAVGMRPLETKHSNSSANLRDSVDYYTGQLAHYAAVYGVERVSFSVIPGNDEPLYAVVEIAQAQIDELMQLEEAFWWHVTEDEAPERTGNDDAAALTKSIAATIKVNGFRKVDMQGNNEWADAAARFIAYREPAKLFDMAKEDLKSLVANDVAEASGHGLQIKRDKRGAMRITEVA
jgi:predicted phage-related endonuclease